MANTYNNIDITSIFDVSKQITDLIRQNYLKEEMSPNGKLAKFTWTVSYDGSLYQLQLNLPPEWKWVEFGRYPGPVSKKGVESLKEWISVKLGVPKGTKEMDTAAFLIARKIKRVGYYTPRGAKSMSIPMMGMSRGKHVIEKSLNEAEPLILELCNVITQKINETINKEIVTVFDGLESFTKAEIQN